MQLHIHKTLQTDVVHFYDAASGECIRSTGNRFTAELAGQTHRFAIPVSAVQRTAMVARIARRALRLDKSNVVVNHRRDGLVILFQGGIWFYDLASRDLRRVGSLRQCRNVLHCGIAVTAAGIFFGEYGANPSRAPVPLWGSHDDGRSWRVVWQTPPGRKHIHGVYADPYGNRLWIPTGDFDGECFVVSASPRFDDVITYGDGSQAWRPVSMFFERDRIAWVMDTQLETPFLQIFDRLTGTLSKHGAFPGPCWYGKQLADGWSVLQTTVEIGPGVTSDHIHLYASRNLTDWSEFARFRKDRWPMRFFKFGVVAFAEGPQTSRDFVMFGEAVRGMDGRAVFGALVDAR